MRVCIYTVKPRGLEYMPEIELFSSPSYIDPATTQIDSMRHVLKLERKGEGELVDLDKVVDHETSPGNPSHVAVADEVNYKEAR